MQEKKALSSRGRGRLRGFLELRRPWVPLGAVRGGEAGSRVSLGHVARPERFSSSSYPCCSHTISSSKRQIPVLGVFSL